MSQLCLRCFLLTAALLLSACSRDVVIFTELQNSGSLRPGDKVFLAEREAGTVRAIAPITQATRTTVEISLYPDQAGLVQSNAVAYVALEGAPALVLRNPEEPAEPVEPGERLRGLSALEAAIWRAGTAAEAVSGIVDQFSKQIVTYLQSEDWARTQAEIESEIAELASDSRQAAQSVVEELQDLFDSINDRAADGAQQIVDELAEIEAEIRRLEKEGHEQLGTALRRLLEQIKALKAPNRDEAPVEAKQVLI